jgi:hypothetical protein
MKKLEYNINIASPPKKVWNIMLQPGTYKEWANASWPDSFYEGKWAEGENVRFISEDGSGTLATIESYKPHNYISAKHIAILNRGGIEDRESDVAKGWIGITESYTFKEKDDTTDLKVEIYKTRIGKRCSMMAGPMH